jgi:hypothetical protein
MKETEYFVSLLRSVVLTEDYNIMVNSEKLIGTTEFLTLQTRRPLNRCRYNRDWLYIIRPLTRRQKYELFKIVQRENTSS